MLSQIGEFDWAGTGLGPLAEWPQSLRAAIRILAASSNAMWLVWSRELTFLCNDACRLTLGIDHALALGRPVREVLPWIWRRIGPRVAAVLGGGQAAPDQGLLLLREYAGFTEETYHTFSYSPLTDDAGRRSGVLCAVAEETERIIGERRMTALRQFAAGLAAADTQAKVMAAVELHLGGNGHDLPFSLLYLADPEDCRRMRLACAMNIAPGHALAPLSMEAGMPAEVWPAAGSLGHALPIVVEIPAQPAGVEIPGGVWERPPSHAVAIPIRQPGPAPAAGVLMAALNPHRRYDTGYAGFMDLLVGQLAWALANVRTHEALAGCTEASPSHECAEEKLRRSEAQLAAGQRLSHTGSWEWNPSSGELRCSRETLRILGFEPEHPAPPFHEAMERVHPDDRAAVNSVVAAAVRDAKAYEVECRIALPDGSVKHIHCIGRPRNAHGFVGSLMDVTKRRRAEESLQAAQAQLAHVARVTTMGELVASIAHEVNQPLAAVVSNGDAALRWLAPEPDLDEARAAVGRIVREANRASQVVSRIRGFLKKSEPEASLLDVNALIHEVLLLMRHQILRAEVSLRTELAEDLRHPQGDAVQMQQVVLNLVLNALEAVSPIGGVREIVVASRNQGPSLIVVSVQDSGVGIETGRIEEVFKPFVTTKPKGMGMGLSISRSIVEAHGGSLWALSNGGGGATFLFSLPASPASQN
jgi:signal transduction histidine kinase